MNWDSISISVIMPAYNEEMSILNATHQNIETFSSLGLDYEIIIVNDRSTDKTGIIGDELAEKHESIRCYHHQKKHASYVTLVARFLCVWPSDQALEHTIGSASSSCIEKTIPHSN